ncbi:kinase-like domain-containing protein [Xylariaceae sp. FL0255]|nr:kinase-like domain-containing protein [Xylariaceae sp. FL0255]
MLDFKTIYSVDESEYPAPSPNLEDVFLQPTRTFQSNVQVVQIGEHFIVKYGRNVSFNEAQSMILVKKRTRVPVPTVYAVGVLSDNEDESFEEITLILMERIQGYRLDEFSWRLGEEQKRLVGILMRGHLRDLRRLGQPDSVARYFGAIDGGPFCKESGLNGPYSSESEFIDKFLEEPPPDPSLGPKPQDVIKSEAKLIQQFKDACGENRAYFAHGDLLLHNIMLKPDGSLCIIDWERAGWYPQWFEYVNMGMAAQYATLDIGDKYPEQEAIMSALRASHLDWQVQATRKRLLEEGVEV